jgi:hemolysin activation/secretion protein
VVVDGGDPAPVLRQFADLMDEPLTLPVLTRRLHELSSLPGFQAQASLEPGGEVGETRLRLNVVEQRQWLTAVRVDNHGDAATGDQRLLVDGSWLDPRGVGDRLDAGVLATVNPGNQVYGFLAYETPAAGFRMRGEVGRNDFTWDRGMDRDGEGTYVDFGARRALVADVGRDLEMRFGVARHELDWDDGFDQSVTQIGAELSGNLIDRTARVAAQGMLGLTAGHIGRNRFAGQEADFWALEADMLVWTPVTLPGLPGEQKLSLRLQGQLADSYLPATQRFALSGPYRSRAFDRGDLLVDEGAVLSVDLRIPVSIGEAIVFADTAYGEDLNTLTPAWRHATDVGIAWDADLTSRLTSRLSLALPLTTKGTGGIDDDGSRFYWSLRYAH